MALVSALAIALTPTLGYALPQDGVVNGGAASIGTSGNTMNINQSTSRAIIDWSSFNIGSSESVIFSQPSSSAIALNRIHDSNPSQILGTLSANGQVWLLNQNGVMFGQNAQVNVAGLLVTTANISNANFMADNYVFDTPGSAGASITNAANITVADGGLAAFVAPTVTNSGVITARLGKVQLGSADTFTLDLYGDGLINLAASPAVTAQLIQNSGTISANGGSVLLTTAAAQGVVNSLINMDGVVQANAVSQQGGSIVLYASGSNAVDGNVVANKGKSDNISTVEASGTISATGKNAGQTGGSITVTGDHVGILTGAAIDASGDAGGGGVHVGGDFHGGGTTPTALNTIVQTGATITADALTTGDGGNVTVWSDNYTNFAGSISAKGGAESGNGGFVETSGKINLQMNGSVDASAAHGNAGTWLMDPEDVTISTGSDSDETGTPSFVPGGNQATAIINVTDIDNALNAGTSVTITTGGDSQTGPNGGSITVANAISATTGTAGITGDLTLSSYKDIIVNAAITLGGAGVTGGNLTLRADNAANSAGAIAVNANITTNGGNITMGGGSGTITAAVMNADGTVATPASGYAWGDAMQVIGVKIGSTVNAGGGNVIENGHGYNTSSNSNYGIWNHGSAIQTSGGGNISLSGIGGDGTTANHGVSSDGTMQTTNGNITIVGTGGNGTTSNNGVTINGTLTTATGAITINGTGGSGGTSASYTGNDGILSGITINSTGSGATCLSGTGGVCGAIIFVGNTASDFGTEIGVFLQQDQITSADANINITGTGHGVAAGSNSRGVQIQQNSATAELISTTGSGNITIVGTGGAGTSLDYGVTLFHSVGSGPDLTVSATGTGNIAITGTAVDASNSDGINVNVSNKNILVGQGGSGTITFTGTATGTGKDLDVTNAVNGFTIGGASATGNIYLNLNTATWNTTALNTSGTVTIAPRSAGTTIGVNNSGAVLNVTSGLIADISSRVSEIDIGSTADTGTMNVSAYSSWANNVKLISGSGVITIAGAQALGSENFTIETDATPTFSSTVTTTGLITVETSGATTLGVGTNATGTVNLTDTVLSTDLIGGSYQFGSTTTGALDINTAATNITAKNLSFISGGTIFLDKSGDTSPTALTKSSGGASTLTMQAGTDIILNNAITASGSGNAWNILLDSDYALGGGAILVGGNVTTNNGSFTAGGGNGAITGGSHNADGTVNVAATGYAVGDASVTNSDGGGSGVYINDVTVSAGTGNIIVNGQGYDNAGGSGNSGVFIYNNAMLLTTVGNITVNGIGVSGTISDQGVQIKSYAANAITTTSGAITITGISSSTSAGVFDNNGLSRISSTGTGAGLGDINIYAAGTGVGFQSTGSVSTVDANIIIRGVATGTYGIYNNGGSIQSTGSGNITINGFGGGTGGSSNYGVYNLGTISASGTGSAISITGTGGSGAGTYDVGVYIYGGSVTASGDDTISITGYGGGTGGSFDDIGVYIRHGGTVSGVNGTITINGTGGGGTGGSEHGIFLSGDGTNTVTTTGAGSINITGTGAGASGSTQNIGIGLGSGSGGGVSSVNGNISITGYGSMVPGTSSNWGIEYAGGTSVASTGTGTITLTGIAGVGANSYGLYNNTSYASGGGAFGGGSTSANITLITDSISYSTAPTVQTTGNITVKEYTPGTTIGVGTNSTGSLKLTDTYLGYLNGGTLTIGDTGAGALDINTAATNITAKNLSFISGGTIYLDKSGDTSPQNLVKSSGGTSSLTLQAGTDIVTGNNMSIIASGGGNVWNVLFDSNYANGGGAIAFGNSSAITSNNGNITLGGGSGAITGTVLNADGTVANAATGFATGDANYSAGVSGNGWLLTAGTGNIVVNGSGYNTTTNNNYGVLSNGATNATSTTGNISITGMGGGGSGDSSGNFGIYSTKVSTASGTIDLTGIGGGSGSGFGNYGISPNASTSGAGAIIINGTGGIGNSRGIGDGGITAATTGTITLLGTGTHGGAGIGSGSTYSVVDGALSMTAAAGGFFIGNGVVFGSTGLGAITINAETGGFTTNNNGTNTIGSTTDTGAITLIADSLSGPTGLTFNTSGVLTIKPYTPGTTIGVANSSYGLNVTSAFITDINSRVSEIDIGSTADTGTMNVSAYSSWANNVKLISGSGVITIAGAQALGSENFTIETDATPTFSSTVTTTGLITMETSGATTLGVGTNATGTVNLTDTVLSTDLIGGSYQFGSTTTGALDINTAVTTITAKNLSFISGGTIYLDKSGDTSPTALTKSSGGATSLTMQAGTDIMVNKAITASGSGNVWNITLDSDYALGGGAILVGGNVTTNNGSFTAGGGNAGITGGSHNADGTVNVAATGYAMGDANIANSWGGGSGVYFNGASVKAAAGNIIINGQGYDNAGGSGNVGVDINTGGFANPIQTTTGNITINGIGSNGTVNDHGIANESFSAVSTTSGAITMTGTGGSATGTNGSVGIYQDSVITSTGSGVVGNISIYGTSAYGPGILGYYGSQYTTVDANLILYGSATGSTGVQLAPGVRNEGVADFGGGSGSTGVGHITITGFGGAFGGSDVGVGFSNLSAATGSITITGTGGSGGDGVQLVNILSTGSAPITITGIAGSGTGIRLGTSTVGGGSAAGDITLIADTITLGVGTNIQTTGNITAKEYTAGRTIGIGTNASGLLNWSDTYLSYLNGGSYTFGDHSAGAIDINTAQTNITAKNLSFISGGTIYLDKSGDTSPTALTKSSGGATSLTMQAGTDIISSGFIDATGGGNAWNILMDSDYAGGGGGIVLNAGINSNNGNITLGGGNGAITAGTLNADGTVNVAGTGYAVGDAATSGTGIYLNDTAGANGYISLNSGAGNVIVNGQGSPNDGVQMQRGFLTTSGNVTMNGIGTGQNNGVSTAYVSTINGAITLNGTTNSNAFGGVTIGVISSSGTVAGNGTVGAITINGTETGAGGGNNNVGVLLNTVSAVDANIVINGANSGSCNAHCGGVLIGDYSGSIYTTGLGNITITGTNTGGGNSYGVQIGVPSGSGGSVYASGSGNVTITGNSTNSTDIYSYGSGNTIGNSSGTGDITLIANSINLNGSDTVFTAGGNINIHQRTNGTNIAVGDAATGGGLALSDADIGDMSWGSGKLLTIGDTNSGNMDINTADSFTKAVQFTTAAGKAITLDSALVGTSAGAFGFTGPTTLKNNILTAGGAVTFNSAVTLGTNSNISTAGGNVGFGSAVDGAHNLTVSAGTGAAGFTGKVGNGAALGNLTITADSLTLGDNLFGTGTLTIKPATVGRAINLNHAGGGLSLSTAEIGYLQNDWGSVVIGASTDTATLTAGALTWAAPVTLLNGSGDITLSGAQTAGANTFFAYTLLGNLNLGVGAGVTSSAAGNAIVVASGGNFDNGSGSTTPFVLTGGGRFIGYSYKAGDDTNAVSNAPQLITGFNYGTLAPGGIVPATYNGTQNTWVYDTASGSINLTALAQGITYGAAPNLVAINGTTYSFTCSDGCLAASVMTTAPTLAVADTNSLGLSGSGNRNVGTWSITLSAAADNNGYTINYFSGALTISPKNLNVTGLTGVVSKVYNGNATATLASGNYTTDAFGSDNVSVGTTAGTYNNKNAGVGKSVSVTNLGITGADAGDYTLITSSISGAVGTITADPITVTASTSTKTYDGTTAASATPTITVGALQGSDSIGFSETYGSKNVGTNLTLTPAGIVNDGNSGNNYTYTFVTDGTGAITTATLNVIADNQSKTVGAANPALTYHFSGLQGSDNSGVVSGAASLSTAADSNSPIGSYPIDILLGGLTAQNYTFNLVDGTLTVHAVQTNTGGPDSWLHLQDEEQLPDNMHCHTGAGGVPLLRRNSNGDFDVNFGSHSSQCTHDQQQAQR